VEVERLIHRNFPELQVVPSNYPQTPNKALAGKIISIAQFSFLGVALGGEYILPLLSISPQHPFSQYIQQNKMPICAFLWIVGNMVTQSLQSTGAFEISYNGHMVYSKLEKGKLPTSDEIINTIKKIAPPQYYQPSRPSAPPQQQNRKVDRKKIGEEKDDSF